MLLLCLEDGDTAVMKASQYGHFDVVKHLVEHKTDVNAKNNVMITMIDDLFNSQLILFCDDAMVSAV